jgi:hypothetical protein
VRCAVAVAAVPTVSEIWREVATNVEELESTILPRVPEEGPVRCRGLNMAAVLFLELLDIVAVGFISESWSRALLLQLCTIPYVRTGRISIANGRCDDLLVMFGQDLFQESVVVKKIENVSVSLFASSVSLCVLHALVRAHRPIGLGSGKSRSFACGVTYLEGRIRHHCRNNGRQFIIEHPITDFIGMTSNAVACA